MQIIIDIPEETYRYMQEHFVYYGKNSPYLNVLEKAGVAIREGVPLPNGHGDLYGENDIRKQIENPYQCQTVLHGLKLVKPIIEVDKEELKWIIISIRYGFT